MCPLEVLVRTNERSELCETVCRIAGIEIFDFEGGGGQRGNADNIILIVWIAIKTYIGLSLFGLFTFKM